MRQSNFISQIGDADLKLLRIFKSVTDSGGFAAAETELNIGRSTISKYIADLEARLNLKLCNRGPAGFSLTEEGEHVLEAADRLLASVADFRVEVNDIKQQLIGTLRIAFFDQCASNPGAYLAKAISHFHDIAPNVSIDLAVEPPTVIETKLLRGELDIGIFAQQRSNPSLELTPLHGETMYLYCGVDHPFFDRDPDTLGIDDIRKAQYAGIGVTSPNLFIGQQLKLRRTAKVQNELALSVLILSGRYLGFLPDHLARDFVARGLMTPLLPHEINYRAVFSATVRRTPAPNRITALFLDSLKTLAQEQNADASH